MKLDRISLSLSGAAFAVFSGLAYDVHMYGSCMAFAFLSVSALIAAATDWMENL